MINNKITIIDLSRNFGHHKAMMTGLKYAKGDLTYLLDSDLEESPEWVLKFNDVLCDENIDVVYGVQKKRKGLIFERISGLIFYRIFRALTEIDLPDNIVTARLMRKKYVDSLLLHNEKTLSIGGIWAITGFNQKYINVIKKSKGNTTYTLRKKIITFVDAITSFSAKPLFFIFYFGLIFSLACFMYVLYLAFSKLFFENYAPGFSSVMVSIWLFSGLIILFIGIIGLYVSKIFIEVKSRPLTIIKNIYKSD
jgi:putative glycosyltransferase